MNGEAYERLLNFLASDDETDGASLNGDVVEQMVAEAASLLGDLRTAADDLPGAALWKQVAADTGQPRHSGFLEEVPAPWLDLCTDNQDERKMT